jgi:hypothetical protein
MHMARFIAGAIAGGVAVWMWGDDARDALAEKTRGVRTRTADQIQAVQRALARITSTLQSGQDAIRPSKHSSRVRPIAR